MPDRQPLSCLAWSRALLVVLSPLAIACSPARPAQAPAAVPVRVLSAHAIRQPATVRVSGVTEARTTADVAFQVGGKVIGVGVDEGDRVAAGQFLAQVDPTDYRLALDQAELARHRAADELARAEQLRATNSIPPNDYDKARTAAQETVVERDLAAKHLADARLAAPFTGIVARKAVERGATAAVGTPVFTVVDLDEVEVRVGVSESDIAAVRSGAQATVTVAGLPGRSFGGRVKLAGVAADPQTRTYTVKIAVANPTHEIKAGMVAEAVVRATGETTVIRVLGSAITRDPQGATVLYVYSPTDRRVHQRRVEVGDVSEHAVEIRDGVTEGELIVVAGQNNVRDGDVVVVENRLTDPSQRELSLGRVQP